jgi:hypothetical protein
MIFAAIRLPCARPRRRAWLRMPRLVCGSTEPPIAASAYGSFRRYGPPTSSRVGLRPYPIKPRGALRRSDDASFTLETNQDKQKRTAAGELD